MKPLLNSDYEHTVHLGEPFKLPIVFMTYLKYKI